MSQENVDLVAASMFGAGIDLVPLAERGAFEEALEPSAFSPDVEIIFVTPSGPATSYHGMAGMLRGWKDWLTPWASYEVRVEELVDAGERVVALVMLVGRTERDAVEIQHPGAAVTTVSDGKIVRVEFHLDRREALESAGLSA